MATVRILLGIICLVVFGQFTKPDGNFLGKGLGLGAFCRLAERTENPKLTTEGKDLAREVILSIARSQIGVREATGKNDGKMVEAYLHYTGNKKGAPWCASFVSWVFAKAGFDAPRTAGCSVLFPLSLQTTKPKPAVVFGIYFASLKRIGHCGFVEEQKNNWLSTIEGNTNVAGSREGDGVYRKIRHKKTIAGYADWQREKEGAK